MDERCPYPPLEDLLEELGEERAQAVLRGLTADHMQFMAVFIRCYLRLGITLAFEEAERRRGFARAFGPIDRAVLYAETVAALDDRLDADLMSATELLGP